MSEFSIKKLTFRNIYFFSALVFAFLLPFSLVITRYALAAFAISWFFIDGKRLKDINWKSNTLFLLTALFFLLYVASMFYSENFTLAFRDIQKKLSFVLLPLIFSSTSLTDRHRKFIMLFFVTGVFFTTLISLGHFVYQYFTDSHFAKVMLNYPLYQFYSKFYLFGHSSYYSLFLVMSLVIVIYILKEGKFVSHWKSLKGILLTLIPLFIVVTMLNSSRAGLVSMILVLFPLLFYLFRKKYHRIMIIGFVIIAGIMIGNNYRFRQSMKVLKTTLSQNKVLQKGEDKEGTLRLFIWKTSVELIGDNFWFGVGNGDIKQELDQRYKAAHKNFERKFNPHNQFLSTFLATGVAGFLILLAVFVLGFFKAVKQKHILLFVFLLLTLVHFQFEAMLYKLNGVLFFSFFLSILWYDKAPLTGYRSTSVNTLRTGDKKV